MRKQIDIQYRRAGAGAAAGLVLLASVFLGGCGGPDQAVSESGQAGTEMEESQSGATGPGSETGQASESGETGSESVENPGESMAEGPEREESRESEAAEREEGLEKKIVVATDMHYLAEKLAGNRCQTFRDMIDNEDGRVLQYGWEVMDAFVDDMLKEQPDLVVLSGDLTLNGEKESHEELAGILDTLLEHDIEVAVIPGNHDINNPHAKRFYPERTEKVSSVTAEEFEEIYADCGYVAADSRDPASLSYLYKLDDSYWMLMLDSCQYDPTNEMGGMIRRETYEWMEEILEEADAQGAEVISVTHHNLLDQSGVSRDFYDHCTIEHNEELVGMLAEYDVRLHLSGHLHLQHYMEDEDTGIYEIITGSMVMAPCNYGVLKLMEDGTYQYDAVSVDVDGWAERNSYKNRDLADFKTYSEEFLAQFSYRKAMKDLESHMKDRKFLFTREKLDAMAQFYAKLCVYYYGGRMIEIAEAIKEDPALEYWNEIDYVSDISDFLRNILDDEAMDFAHLTLN